MKKIFLILLIGLCSLIAFNFTLADKDQFSFLDLSSYYFPKTKRLNVKEMRINFNDPILLGKGSAYYDLRNDPQGKMPYNYFYQGISPNESYKGKIDDSEIQIIVDTLNKVSIRDFNAESAKFYAEFDDFNPDLLLDTAWLEKKMPEPKYVEGIPVYLMNSSDKTTSINTEASPFIIQEAKNEKGEWKPIEYEMYGFCGNGYSEIVLEPNYFLVTFIYKYYGDFQTELRIKLRNNKKIYYSQPFKGNINLSQFNVPKEILNDSSGLFRFDFLDK